MNRWVYIILLLLCSSVFAFGQMRNDTDFSLSDHAREVAERNAAQGFNDTIDRLAEDFVEAYVVVADPGEVLYSVLGHACLHFIIILIIWIIVMVTYPHIVVEWAHILLTLAFSMILVKQAYINE